MLPSHRVPDASRSRSCGSHRRLLGRGLLAVLALAPLPLTAATLEVYGRLPRLEHIALSPDGARVAFVRTNGDERILVITDLASGRLLGQVRAGDEKLRGIEWADDSHVVIETSVTGVLHGNMFRNSRVWEWFQAQVYDLASRQLLPIPQSKGSSEDLALLNVIGSLDVRRVRDRTVIFVTGVKLGKGGRRQLAENVLLSVSLDTHAVHLVSEAKPETVAWTVDGDGAVAAEETYDQKSGHWSMLVPHDGHPRPAASGTGLIEFPHILGMGPTADTLLVSSIEDEEPVWRLLSLKDGTMSAPMAERKLLEHPIESRATHRLIGGVHIGDSAEYVFFDPATEQTWQAIVRAFPNERVRLESASSDFGRVIVRVEGARDGFGYQLVDLTTHRAEPLGDIYEGVGAPFEVRRITYAAGDGLMIPAYLTLPRKPAQKLPLIVLPHGGPAVRDTADFDWWSQALADQGYAVLRPNYRGSQLQRAFLVRGFGEWGRKMQTDLSDGVRYLAGEGIVDPARVCIVGASYGGYAALAGVSLDPGVYRCAVSVAGLSDLQRMLTWVNLREFSAGANQPQRYWDRFMGVSGPADPALDAISPIRHVAAITVPVLLIHGRDDTVVPFEQTQVMFDALQKEKKDVQLIALDGEDHWLSRSTTRLQMLQASVAFLRQHNPPDP